MYISDDERTGRFTFEAEGSLDPKNPCYIGRLVHPSAESGVTIGAGYDMGGRTELQVKSDLVGAGLDRIAAERLAKGAGLTGAAATRFVVANAHLLVDVQILRSLFATSYPGYVTRARSNFRYHASSFRTSMSGYGKEYKDAIFFDWEYLYPSIRVMAIDFTYQGFGRQAAGYGRPLHFCMANDFDWLIAYITNTPGISKYEKGRHRAGYLRDRMAFEIRNYSNCPVNE